ncbi:nuclear transcription factor Y, gamma, partial [Tremellales sp. Uapishka_1]
MNPNFYHSQPSYAHPHQPQAPSTQTSGSDPSSPQPTTSAVAPVPLVEPHQDLNEFLATFWTRQMDSVERENPDFKTYPLPLARIKKVMKSDEEVKRPSCFRRLARVGLPVIEASPVPLTLVCSAVFISELTCRAWLIAESHKRRTLQKSDVAAAIAFSDMFDFLIDVVPRDDGEGSGEGNAATSRAETEGQPSNGNGGNRGEEAAGTAKNGDENEDDQDQLYSEFVQNEGEGFG